jgi:hypothetical protein
MKEIAARLDISEKTVENHLGNALKKLRLSLREFLGGIALAVAWFVLSYRNTCTHPLIVQGCPSGW